MFPTGTKVTIIGLTRLPGVITERNGNPWYVVRTASGMRRVHRANVVRRAG